MRHNFLLLILLTNFIVYSQCKIEIIQKDNYYYEGCLNYEGEPNGNGIQKVTFDDQTQLFEGKFLNGNFQEGKHTVNFNDGNIKYANYLDYPNRLLSDEVYRWPDGSQRKTFYELGNKIKEVKTFGAGDQSGLIIETFFKNGEIIEKTNIENNREPSDIVGNSNFIDIDLIENNNQFRIPIEFLTKNASYITVPIQFDTGATNFLIGHKLYQELVKECEIIDLNVKGKISGVGSQILTKYIKIKEIKIGNYKIKNVVAIVPIETDQNGNHINDILIGIGFLKKFKDVEWSLNSNKMRFYK